MFQPCQTIRHAGLGGLQTELIVLFTKVYKIMKNFSTSTFVFVLRNIQHYFSNRNECNAENNYKSLGKNDHNVPARARKV